MKLVIADDHKGLRAAAAKVFAATHQRCRVGLLNKSAFEASLGTKGGPSRCELGGAFYQTRWMGNAGSAWEGAKVLLGKPDDEDCPDQIGASRFRLMAAAVK